MRHRAGIILIGLLLAACGAQTPTERAVPTATPTASLSAATPETIYIIPTFPPPTPQP